MNSKMNKSLKILLSIGATVALTLSTFSVQASGTSKVLKNSQFKSQYLNLCLSLEAVPQAKRSKFCDCMLTKYQKAGFTSEKDLDLIKKVYRGKSKPVSEIELKLFNFDLDASEECLGSNEPQS